VAVVLTSLVVLGAALLVTVAGVVAGIVAAAAAMVAVLSFVTLRAYAPDERIPWAMLVVLTILAPVLPLIYLSWRWVRKPPTSPPVTAQPRRPSRPVHGV